MTERFYNFFNRNNSFLLLLIFTVFLSIFTRELINSDELLNNSLGYQFTNEQIDEILEFRKKWEWIGYFIIPLFLIVKISVIAIIIDVGCFFFNKEIKYKILFNIVTKAEFVFLGVIILKTLWFYVFQQDYTLEDLQNFYPLSALNIIGYEDLQAWFIYPLQVLNLFEVAYWFVLVYLLEKELNISTDKGFSIVASSYGIALLIWVVGVMFFTLNMS